MGEFRTELKKFLVNRPQPRKVRTLDPDRLIEVPQNKGGWKQLESTLLALEPASIECLDEAGGLLRAMDLREIDSDDKRDKDADPLASHKHLAAVLDAHGRRMIEAFQAGVEASSSQQSHLVKLVHELTAHLSHALTNLHRLSAQVATLQTATATNADDAVAGQLLAAAMGGRLPELGGNGNGKG